MPSNDFKLTFTLKQHTPIIHFQHDQTGATLRATELKPKLDRFLIEKFKKDGVDYKPFLIAGQDGALDYKVRVEPNNNQADENDKSLKNYFGNQGNSAKKYPKLHKGTLTIEIKSFNRNLLKSIEENFASFLAVTNFGTRQTKGYGSFYLDKKSIGYKPIEDVLPTNTYYLEVDNRADVDEVIKYFWNRLKSGINLHFNEDNSIDTNEKYKHSFLKICAYSQKIKWEKRWIKETFFGLKSNEKEAFFVRALLGLSSTFSYMKSNEPNNPNKNNIKIDNPFTIEVSHPNLSRIPSPILFKPIKHDNKKTKIYILLDQEQIQKMYECINSEPFEFCIFWGKSNDKKPKIDRYDDTLFHVPKKDLSDSNYKNFLNSFWQQQEKQTDKYKPKIYELHIIPQDRTSVDNLIEKYFEHLGNKFDVYFPKNKMSMKKVSVSFASTTQGGTNAAN